jgi:hypothetical protein
MAAKREIIFETNGLEVNEHDTKEIVNHISEIHEQVESGKIEGSFMIRDGTHSVQWNCIGTRH